jgi:hypothetical protein
MCSVDVCLCVYSHTCINDSIDCVKKENTYPHVSVAGCNLCDSAYGEI